MKYSPRWSNCKKCKHITIDNYELLKIISPLKNGSVKGRKSGGMHIYCKSHTTPYLKVIKTSTFYLWLEIDNNLFYHVNKNLLACAIYAQPITSTYYSNEIDNNLFYHVNKNLLACAIYAQPITSTYYSNEIWNELEIDLLNPTANEPPFLYTKGLEL